MPPKKAAGGAKSGVSTSVADEDLSDVAQLPKLNEFIFFNFYAFKYRRNLQKLDQQLYRMFYKSPEGETAEAFKRNRVV